MRCLPREDEVPHTLEVGERRGDEVLVEHPLGRILRQDGAHLVRSDMRADMRVDLCIDMSAGIRADVWADACARTCARALR